MSRPHDPPTGEETRLRGIVARFAVPQTSPGVERVRGGLINRSWSVRCGSERFLLQQINTEVFPEPDALMANICMVTTHLHRADPETPTLEFVPVAGSQGQLLFRDGGNGVWRLARFIAGTTSHSRVAHPSQALAASRAYGRFLHLLADLPADQLHETLPGFHATPTRYQRLQELAAAGGASAEEASDELARLAGHRSLADTLPRSLPRRVIHGDAKLSNVLLDPVSHAAVCVVDLDTVMAGYAAWDFGDMVRSMACTEGEEHTDIQAVALDPTLFQALLSGYLQGTSGMLTATERQSLFNGALCITFEQAVRYLTDHLDGDRYYRTSHRGQNLTRCRNQLQLLDSMVAQRHALEAMVQG